MVPAKKAFFSLTDKEKNLRNERFSLLVLSYLKLGSNGEYFNIGLSNRKTFDT